MFGDIENLLFYSLRRRTIVFVDVVVLQAEVIFIGVFCDEIFRLKVGHFLNLANGRIFR